MQDSFNLGWKLASVLRGQARPELLRTYSAERRAVAQELIDFDRELATMFSARPKDVADAEGDGVDPAEFQRYFEQKGRFTAGVATRYRPSLIGGDGVHQHLAAGFPTGMRFHSAPVVRLADAKRLHLGHVAKADGRWRLFLFAGRGDAGQPGGRIEPLCSFLENDARSPIRRYTPATADIDTVIDVRAVFQDSHRDLDFGTMPSMLRPTKGRYGLTDYEKIFCPDITAGADVFDMRRVDRDAGCMIVVRPDQYVATILPLEAEDALSDFFDGVLVDLRARSLQKSPAPDQKPVASRVFAEMTMD